MKATVNLDDRLYRRVKIKAAEEGVTVTSIFEAALRRYLNGRERGADALNSSPRFEVPVINGSGGLMPGVDLSDSAELQRLLDAERPIEQLR